MSLLKMSCYPEPDSHIKYKVKVVLEYSSYATKKELKYAAGIDTADLNAKNIFLLWKLKLTNLALLNWLMFQLVWII